MIFFPQYKSVSVTSPLLLTFFFLSLSFVFSPMPWLRLLVAGVWNTEDRVRSQFSRCEIFLADDVTLGQFFLRILALPLSVSLPHYCILVFIYILFLPGQTGKACVPSK